MSIKLKRLRGQQAVEILPKIVEHLVFPEETQNERQMYIKGIVYQLQQAPATVCLVVATKDENVVGFIVAVDNGDHVFVSQFYSQQGNPWSIAEAMMGHVMVFTVGQGHMRVRGETTRDVDAALRRFGFEERCVMVERKIDPETLKRFRTQAQETLNG